MAYMQITDAFQIDNNSIVVTGISKGGFSSGTDAYVLTNKIVEPLRLKGIESEGHLLDACGDEQAVGLLLYAESSVNIHDYMIHVAELDQDYVLGYVTDDKADLDWLVECLPTAEDIVENIILEIQEQVCNYEGVLCKKYKQLSYVDEYDELYLDDFYKEARFFIVKKLGYEGGVLDFSVKHLTQYIHSKLNGECTPNDMDTIVDPYEYEAMCAQTLSRMDWTITPTPRSGDQGADVIAEKEGVKIVMQCKLYSSPVGNKAVQEVVSAREYFDCDFAFVVSNNDFTKSARQLADSTNVSLLHHSELELLDKALFNVSVN